MAILMNLPPDGKDYSDSAYKRLGNPKRKRYLDPPAKTVKTEEGKKAVSAGGYVPLAK